MTIIELARYYNLRSFTPYAPFVVQCYPARRTTAEWWTDTFGAEGDDSAIELNVSAITQKPNLSYMRANTLNDCLLQPRSFFWNTGTQVLYIHIDQNIIPEQSSFISGFTSGFTNRGVAYIDDVLYKPLLKAIPSLAQQAELDQYDLMAFIAGQVEFINSGGQFDDIIDDAIHGNDVFLYYLESDTSRFKYSRSELVQIANLYVENYTFSLAQFLLDVQDKRKAMNAKLLQLGTDGKPMPLLYGQIKAAKASVADDTGVPVVYKLAPNMTSLGTVQCLGDYGWTTAPTISYDLEAGTFTVSAIYARSPGNGLGEDTGSVLECRLINPVGIVNASATDVIKDMNLRLLGIEYTSSNYDFANWVIAESLLAPIGVMFTSQKEIYAAIAEIQNSCNLGFRYDIGPDGLRRIIFDDWEKEAIASVAWDQIKDNLTLTVKSDSTLLAGTIVAKYGHDYYEDTWETFTDDSKLEQVIALYRQSTTMEIPTYLVSESAATQRAAFAASRFSKVFSTAEVTLQGAEWYALRIYDIITLELKTERRAYFGTWKAQIIAVDPALDALTTKISAVLIERI